MKEQNVAQEKSEDFAVRICNLYKFLSQTKQELIISKQILRSGTSIGANIAEALYAESKDDFIHKLKISRKEANETRYWLKLLFRSETINSVEYSSMLKDCEMLIKLLTRIIISTSENNCQP